MKFKCLDGSEVGVDLRKKRIAASKSKSQAHLGELLSILYGNSYVLEEFSIPKERLFIDFFIPRANLAFEFQGRQHDKFVEHFHGDKKNFLKHKDRDRRKREWCHLNRITLVEVQDPEIALGDLKKLIMKCQRMET